VLVVVEEKPRTVKPARGRGPSVFGRQIDDVVSEPQRDRLHGKIRELKLLHIDDIEIAVFAGDGSGMVGPHGQLPDLKPLGGDAPLVPLTENNGVKYPVSASLVGNVLGAVREKHLRIKAVPIPVFGAGKLF
jgi:hypothetical protein